MLLFNLSMTYRELIKNFYFNTSNVTIQPDTPQNLIADIKFQYI